MSAPLIIGQRYTMPDGNTGKYIGLSRGTHADYHCFRMAGAAVVIAKLMPSQIAALEAERAS